ncbi:MAG: hypothetical protein M3Y17_13465, partial [Actinomycetota bacterium]|nr:hypothetical protein [Actinomycetota bacterium]
AASAAIKTIAERAQTELERQKQVHDKWAHKGLGPLLDELGWSGRERLLSALENGDDDAVDAILETALRGQVFLDELRGLLRDAKLTDANRDQIQDGLDALARGRFPSAGALLIHGVEGSLLERSAAPRAHSTAPSRRSQDGPRLC